MPRAADLKIPPLNKEQGAALSGCVKGWQNDTTGRHVFVVIDSLRAKSPSKNAEEWGE